jgi:hypothetical protein
VATGYGLPGLFPTAAAAAGLVRARPAQQRRREKHRFQWVRALRFAPLLRAPKRSTSVILPPVPLGAAVYSQADREGKRAVAQFDILIACYTVGGGGDKKTTQKMNHWEAFEIMRHACTPEGVVAVAAKN